MANGSLNGGSGADESPAAVGAAFVDERALRDAWSIARARWPWILLISVVTIVAAAIHVYRERPIYAAVETVRIDRSPNPIADAQVFAPTYDYRVDPLASEQQIIKSLTIATRTVAAVGAAPGVSSAAAARDFQTRILTRVLPQTDIIEITVVGPDSAWDRRAADGLTRVYGDYSREQAQIRAHGRSQYIAQSLEDQAAALARSQDSLRAFQAAHQASDVTDEQTEVFKRIYEFAGDRSRLALEQAVYLALVGRLAQTDTTDDELRRLAATDAVTHNQSVAGLYATWTDLERARQRLLLSRTDRNVDVQALDSSIAVTARNLRTASALYLVSLDARMASLDSGTAALRRETERYPPLVSEQARRAAVVKTRETEYDALLAQQQIARISEGGETGGVRVLDPATVSPDPIAPKRPRALALALVVGLVLGFGVAVAVERLDDSVRTVDEVRDRFQLPVLGVIPRAGGATVARITQRDPQSPVAEAFRALRTSISFTRALAEPKTVLLTSAGPGEGKSTTAVNLAIAFAQQGQRTLILDADLRRATIDRLFDIPPGHGLTEVLVGRARLDEVTHATDIAHLSIVPSGSVPPNPSELLGSSALRAILDEARARYDMVIIDSPPVLAVTDPAVLASMVDGTIVVVRAGTATRDAVRRTIAQLRATHAHVLGAVVNDVSRRQAGYGAYRAYYVSRAAPSRSSRRPGLPTP